MTYFNGRISCLQAKYNIRFRSLWPKSVSKSWFLRSQMEDYFGILTGCSMVLSLSTMFIHTMMFIYSTRFSLLAAELTTTFFCEQMIVNFRYFLSTSQSFLTLYQQALLLCGLLFIAGFLATRNRASLVHWWLLLRFQMCHLSIKTFESWRETLQHLSMLVFYLLYLQELILDKKPAI